MLPKAPGWRTSFRMATSPLGEIGNTLRSSHELAGHSSEREAGASFVEPLHSASSGLTQQADARCCRRVRSFQELPGCPRGQLARATACLAGCADRGDHFTKSMALQHLVVAVAMPSLAISCTYPAGQAGVERRVQALHVSQRYAHYAPRMGCWLHQI